MNRRAFLGGAAALTVGCNLVRSESARLLGADVPDVLAPPDGLTIDPAHHLLNRAAWGPWPGDVERVRAMGADAWIAEQLDPDRIDDSAARWLCRRFESVLAPAGEAWEFDPDRLRTELARHTLLRAVHSRRQLYEVMVAFWTDHFNIAIAKGDCAYLKPSDDRDVIRRHALGRFRDLLGASAVSPAMLVYLDGTENRRASPADVPNENYARELLELHTLGVHGGYTQRDVMEAARCLTGWAVRGADRWRKGTVEFHPDLHDDGPKLVLGHPIPAGGGERDLEVLLDLVAAHPSTARFVGSKLSRWFVGDESATDAAAAAFTASDGDLREVVGAVLRTEAFRHSAGTQLKRPFRFVVSALRALGLRTHAPPEIMQFLGRMGQPLFEHPTPDGYPIDAHPWLGTLFWRWNFAVKITEMAALDPLDAAHGGQWLAYLAGRRPTAGELANLAGFDARRAAALVLASPAFQVH